MNVRTCWQLQRDVFSDFDPEVDPILAECIIDEARYLIGSILDLEAVLKALVSWHIMSMTAIKRFTWA